MYTGDYKLVQKRGDHTYIDHFNFDETISHEEFYRYYKMRVKSPNTKLVAYKKYFDKDLVRHFEMAYKMMIEAGIELDYFDFDKEL